MSDPIVHFEIPVDDLERASTFYRDTFGWDLGPMPELDYTAVVTSPMGPDMTPLTPGAINGGLTSRSTEVPVPVVTINVDDIDAALARVQEHGGTVVQARQAVADMGYTGYFRDTEGNVTGLWQNAG